MHLLEGSLLLKELLVLHITVSGSQFLSKKFIANFHTVLREDESRIEEVSVIRIAQH